MELFVDVVTKTDENFCALCTNEKDVGKYGNPLHHKGSSFHHVIPNFICQSSDFTAEHHEKAHRDLSMAKAVPGTNDMYFFICTTRTKWLETKHVVFGQVVEEYDILKVVENAGSGSYRTSRRVVIVDCNQLQI
ncbi:peptidyl-prolyl cis-trans isomerase [Striga asiatica]|uniref:Peptidyl-prolyl cis-trans isomerase n=1 Tax=Striga asiatica TaxID=4170 RepID=A0A5A7QG98_STRAF|nr:peptidyl-prolyl cis-trans isomerase [Striga asiatica]